MLRVSINRLVTMNRYSTIWLARGVPASGSVTTLEISEKHAKVCLHSVPKDSIFSSSHCSQVARENIANAGLADKVNVIVGPAADSLKTLEPNPPYDFAFIDADKTGSLVYFTEAKRLVRSGGVIVSAPQHMSRQYLRVANGIYARRSSIMSSAMLASQTLAIQTPTPRPCATF